jgi:putative SOS response-associated peptidase YedK
MRRRAPSTRRISADEMICWPVSPRVGKVRNNDSSLIEPVAVA